MSFQLDLPDDVIFTQLVQLDLCWVNGKAILRMSDTGMLFSVRRFVKHQHAKTIWHTFIFCWSSVNPESLLTDQISIFMSSYLVERCYKAAIYLRHTGTELHNPLGSNESSIIL